MSTQTKTERRRNDISDALGVALLIFSAIACAIAVFIGPTQLLYGLIAVWAVYFLSLISLDQQAAKSTRIALLWITALACCLGGLGFMVSTAFSGNKDFVEPGMWFFIAGIGALFATKIN